MTLSDGNGITATLTKNVTIIDKKKPKVRLRHVKRVREPHKAVIRGAISDESGISRVTIRFGDDKSARVKLGRAGAFVVRHRYRLDKKHAGGRTFHITVTAVDKAGNKTTHHASVRVMPRK